MKFSRMSLGIDSVAFEDDQYNVYGITDPTKAELNISYEIAEKRGGAGNEIRDARVHSRNGEITIETGYVDEKLAALLSGGTITSLGTSAATVTTEINSLFGGTNTIKTAFSVGTAILSPAQVTTERFYIEALSATAVSVTRQSDGKVINSYALTSNGTITLQGHGIALLLGSTGVASLAVGEKAYLETRAKIETVNQVVKFDNTRPANLRCIITVTENGIRRQLKINKVIPSGHAEQFSSTEFALKSLTLKAIFDEDDGSLASLMSRG